MVHIYGYTMLLRAATAAAAPLQTLPNAADGRAGVTLHIARVFLLGSNVVRILAGTPYR